MSSHPSRHILRSTSLLSVLLAAVVVSLITSSASAQSASVQPASAQDRGRGSLPVATLQGFVQNRGQWPAEVLFFARHNGIDATLLQGALVLRPAPDPETREAPPPLVLRFPAASAVEGIGLLPTAHHFIRGTGTTSNVPGFGRVVYREVLAGLDIVVRTSAESFAYDLHAAPGVDVADLVIEVEGAQSLELVDGTVLRMQTPAGRVEQHIGESWQVDADSGTKTQVASRFRVLDPTGGRLRYGLEAPGRDPAAAFVLDPSLVYATYVGGPGQELLEGMHVTADGAVYLTAKAGPGAPTVPGAFQPDSTGTVDAWVGKLSPDGSVLEWGTFLGGSATDHPYGIDVDQDGTVVVVGNAFSSDFPTTAGSLQATFAGGNDDIFVTRLSADGSALVWSTFYGGPDPEVATASALFPSGDVLVAAEPFTASPPATPGAFDTIYDPGDQLLARISADGTQLVFQTYFKTSWIGDIEFDSASNIYFTGDVLAQDIPLPTTPGAFKETMDPGDAADGYVAKMDPTGTQLLWATYLGGDEGADSISGIAVDAASAVYVAGLTGSDDFPLTPGAFDVTSGGGGFVTKLLPSGSGLVWSTYLTACCGGTSLLDDVAVDSAGNAIATGSSNEPNFPTTPDAFQPNYIGVFPSGDAHLTKFDAFGETLVYSTYFGGTKTDFLTQVGLDTSQDAVMSMMSSSSNIPVTPGAYDTTYGGGSDIVVTKFDLDPAPWQVLGGGLAGGSDTPNLAGAGALTPGSPARLSLRGAAPAANASAVAGPTAVYLPLKGGTLVPSPSVIVSLPTDGQGALDLPFVWPNLPPGIDLYVQVWVQDAGGPAGFSASNALKLTSQ